MDLIVVPIFIIALVMGVETWLWRIVFSALVVLAWGFLGPAWSAVPVALIIGIALRNSLYKIGGSKV